MKRRTVSILVFMAIIFVQVPMVSGGHVFNSEQFTDEMGDGVDFAACFNTETLIPMPIPMEIDSVEIVLSEALDGSGDVMLNFEVTVFPPPLPHMSYTIEVTMDVDDDPTTGASDPPCFYNGGGADFDFGVQVVENSITSTWYDRYVDGGWETQGTLVVDIVEQKISIQVPADVFTTTIEGKYGVHLIMEGGLDSAPSSGMGLIPVEFSFTPQISIQLPEATEGTEFAIDAGESSSRYGEIATYEWDMDNDGVYDIVSPDPLFHYTYPDDGTYDVPVRITDVLGISKTGSVSVVVTNTPPSDLLILHAGNSTDELISFTGFAVDSGNDGLSYTWDFGDGTTGAGEDATHAYDSPGTYTVVMTVTDGDGGETTHETNIDVIQPLTIVPDPDGGGRKDYYTIGVIALVLAGGAWFWRRSQPQPKPEEEEKEEEPQPKDFCEEHPEVVEQENDACWDAQMDLDSAVGDVQDKYDEALPSWQSNAANITKLITEWDATVQMINYWTGVEEDLEEDAETVQEVAGFVTNAAGKAKTVFKEGGEAAMKEIGEDLAKDIGKSVLGDISSTIGQVLELEGWAITEIGLGIAKGLTGVDPEANAVNLRQRSETTFAGLCSWVSHSEAWNSGRRPPDTIQSCLDDIQGMQNALNKAKQDFENATKDFRCIMCPIPENIAEEMDTLRENLEKWEKTFKKLKKEVEKRLEEAKDLYKDKDLYESPYEYLDKAQDNIDRANRALG